MRVIKIEQIENGGKTTIIDKNGLVTYNSNYKNALNLVEDLRNFGFRDCEISTKEKEDNKTILTRNDGTVINLIGFNHSVLSSEIDRKVYDSFKLFLDSIPSQNYDCIYLTGSENKSNFKFLKFPNKTKIIMEFEMDEKGKLTELNKKMLEEFMNKEFRNWFRIFFCSEGDGILKIYYDDKLIVVNSSLIEYVKPEAENMEQIYFEALQNIDKKRGI